MSASFNVPHTPPTAADLADDDSVVNININKHNNSNHNNNKIKQQSMQAAIWTTKTHSYFDQNKPKCYLMQPNSGRPAQNAPNSGRAGLVPGAQPNLRQPQQQIGNNNIIASTAANMHIGNQALPPMASIGASKNPVKAAFRLVQQSWSRVNSVNACDAHDKPMTFRFRYLDVIGNGTFGIVCKAKDVDTDETVAIKTVFQDQHHQYNEEFLSLVLEYMPLSLDKLDVQLRTDALLKRVMHNFLQAVEYLHSRGVCHRDIKPHNVLIDPTNGRAKICDFGCSKRLISGEPNIQYICARYYRAPEIAFGWPHYSSSIDVWSVGCVMAELYTGRPLFPGKNSVDQLAKIVKVFGGPDGAELAAMGQDPRRFRHVQQADQEARRLGLRTALGPHVPEDALDLMFGMLQYDPSRRLTASDALKHYYFSTM